MSRGASLAHSIRIGNHICTLGNRACPYVGRLYLVVMWQTGYTDIVRLSWVWLKVSHRPCQYSELSSLVFGPL